jgi:hypothetical protein
MIKFLNFQVNFRKVHENHEIKLFNYLFCLKQITDFEIHRVNYLAIESKKQSQYFEMKNKLMVFKKHNFGSTNFESLL